MKKTVGIFALLLVMTACSTKRSYVEKGNALFAQGKYQDASINYRKAIQKDAQYGEAYYRLGLSAIKQDQAAEAYGALTRAVRLMPQNIEAKERLADVTLSFYLQAPSPALYQQIIQLADELLAKNTNSYEGLLLKGYLASSDQKPHEAIKFLRKATQIDSSNPGVVTELAHVLIQDGQAQEAEKVATDLINHNKTYGPAYDLMYSLYFTSGRIVDAENILKAKVNNNPKQAEYVQQLAQHYFRSQRPADMKAALQRLLDDPKDFPDGRLKVGDFYTILRDYPEAIRYYEDGARMSPKDKALYQKRQVAAWLGLGKKEEALRLADQIVKENPKDSEALHLHADLLLDSRKSENSDAALREFQALSSQDPNNPTFWLQLGLADRLKGDLNAARDQFQRVLSKRPDLLAARYELAEIALTQLRPDEALQQINEILKLRPNDARAKRLHARALISTGNFVTARTELTRLIQASPHDTEAQVELGFLDLAENKSQEALELFNKVRNTGDPRVFTGLATAYTLRREFDKATEVLNEGLKVSPGSTVILEQLGRTSALRGQYDVAITQFKAVLSASPKSVEARRRLGEVYELKGEHDQAIVFYRQALELAPYDVNVALALGDALVRANRVNEAKVQYQDILKAHPDDASALNDLAFLLADTGGDLDQALKLTQRALAKNPNQPAFADTMGYIYLKKGQHDSAKQTFSNLVHQYPKFAAFRYHLGLVMYEQGDKASAKKELQAAMAEHPTLHDKLKIKELLDKIS